MLAISKNEWTLSVGTPSFGTRGSSIPAKHILYFPAPSAPPPPPKKKKHEQCLSIGYSAVLLRSKFKWGFLFSGLQHECPSEDFEHGASTDSKNVPNKAWS